MALETALFFESVEEIYGRVFRCLKPQNPIPPVTVRFRKYANANSRVRLADGRLTVDISDLLQNAPAPVQEALAYVLLGKLYRKRPDPQFLARYRRYLNRSDIRQSLQLVKQERGRKTIRAPQGKFYDLRDLFEDLNFRYFGGMMCAPELGWSLRPSRSTLGHYDPSHHVIVLSSLLDAAEVPRVVVEFVMFHEMLHLRHPTEHRGVRRCVHTPAFKAAERMFEGYKEARAAMPRLIERL
jgi:hypothetical protein